MAVSINAYQGLTQNVGKRNSAKEDLNTLNQLYNFKKQEEADEQMAEAAYQDTLAKIKAEANNLLQNDRVKINQKAKEYQDGLRAKIKALGGSKQAFMKSGGISDLANYKDQVLSSEEMQVYKNNKVNMEKILMIKERKMGHLLNNIDMQNLNAYNKNGSGEITYSGLLNEVEVDETLFEFNKTITPDDVLKAGNNRYAIIANYEADTGYTYNPSYEDKDLKAYIKLKGYGGLGKNVQMAKLRMAQAKADKEKQSSKTLSANVAVGQVASGGVKSWEDMAFEKGIGMDSAGKRVLGIVEDKGMTSTQHDKFFSLPGNRQGYKLRGGGEFAIGLAPEFTRSFYNKEALNEDGTITLNPLDLSRTYDGKGVPIAGKFRIAKWTHNYKPDGLVMGYKTNVNGEDHIVMDAVDQDGKINEEKNLELYGDSKPEGQPTMFIRMKSGNDERDWFQEVDADSDIAINALGKHFGENNDLGKTQKEQQNLQQLLNEQDVTAEKQARAEGEQANKLAQLDKDIELISAKAVKNAEKSDTINSDYFKLLTEQYNQGGNDRSQLVKSFYQAASQGEEDKLVQASDQKMFDLAIEEYGLKDVLLDKSITDDQFIDAYYRAELKEKPGDIGSYSFAKTLKQIYDKNINPEKQ